MLEELMMKMIEFDCGDPKRIQHFIKVHSFSKLIGEKEGLDAHTLFVLEAASILHDIGIRVSEEKYMAFKMENCRNKKVLHLQEKYVLL